MAAQTVTPPAPFEPELTAFTCGYCAYMSGDTAGALRIQYNYVLDLLKRQVYTLSYSNNRPTL